MEVLDNKIKMNGMVYDILEITSTRYFASLTSVESGNLVAYETGRIVRTKPSTANMGGVMVEFKDKERMVSNEQFGKCSSGFECCMTVKNKNLVHQNYLEAVKWDEKHSKE